MGKLMCFGLLDKYTARVYIYGKSLKVHKISMRPLCSWWWALVQGLLRLTCWNDHECL